MSGLEGKIVLITGASTGIGAGAAKHFAALKGALTLTFCLKPQDKIDKFEH